MAVRRRSHSNIHRAVSDFMTHGKKLLYLLRSSQGPMLSEVELHNLRVYLDLLAIEAISRHYKTLARPRLVALEGRSKSA